MVQPVKQRAQWVDIAKGIAIFFVVWYHAQPLLRPESDISEGYRLLLTWWRQPVFFLLCGFFIKEEKLQAPFKYIKAKVNTTYRMLLNMYIPTILLHNVFLYIGWYDTMTDYSGKFVAHWSLADTSLGLLKTIFFMGREPIMGAMWFVYVLFLALCGYALISWSLKRLLGSGKRYEWVRFGVILSGCILACVLDNFFGINIPRFNITFIALWWIYAGNMLRSHLHVEFNRFPLFLAALAVYYLTSFPYGTTRSVVFLQDMLLNTISYVCALYVVCYIARQIERIPHLSNALAYCGRESFYVMALHFAGFKIVSHVLIMAGIPVPLAALSPETCGSLPLLILYISGGFLLPLLFIITVR